MKTFGYSQLALSQCFQRNPPEPVSLNQFLDTILGESCPPILMWLPLLHRMASVENVYHPVNLIHGICLYPIYQFQVICDSCQVRSFTGFRYKCQRCTNYQLCQSCFWRGRISQSHTNEHEMKEYSSYVNVARNPHIFFSLRNHQANKWFTPLQNRFNACLQHTNELTRIFPHDHSGHWIWPMLCQAPQS